jgi:hypothetical protein
MTTLPRSANPAALFAAAIFCAAFVNSTAADDAAPAAAKQAEMSPPVDKTTYDLKYKCVIGDVWRYEVSHKASIRSTIDDTTQAAQTKTDSLKSWKITDVSADGGIEFVTVVDRVHMINQLPDKDPMEYNSQRDNTPPPGFEDAARSVGVPLSVVRITPRGKVLRRESKIKRQETDEDAPLTVLLPEKPVAVGDSWDEPFDLKVMAKTGGTKVIQTRRHYKLTAVENGIATISIDYQVLTPIDAHIESQMVQRLMDGEVRFDIDAGRVVSQKMEIDRRILGFAGPTSSMHYLMRMEEKLLFAPHKIAVKPAEKPITKLNDSETKGASSAATSNSPSSSSTPRTATRQGNSSSSNRRR